MYIRITYQKFAVLYVEARGKLDIYNAPDYLDEVKEALHKTFARKIILDFSGIINVASIGLRTILELYKMMQERKGILELKNVNDDVLRAFELTGFDKFLTIKNDSEDNPDNI